MSATVGRCLIVSPLLVLAGMAAGCSGAETFRYPGGNGSGGARVDASSGGTGGAVVGGTGGGRSGGAIGGPGGPGGPGPRAGGGGGRAAGGGRAGGPPRGCARRGSA